MEDWSLHAIVRGQSGDFTRTTSDMGMIDGFETLRPFPDNLVDVPDILYGELEDLYKPFYPAPAGSHPLVVEFQEENSSNKNGVGDRKDDEINAAANSASKYKRRKNQHKREVIQVTADGLDADMWAWRKYGQKPIKGSPYPRSYYRCSSSKGCLARKQVEQNCAEPGTYIITYTAEHSHSQPTRRNSLAGTVRQKFPKTKNPPVQREIKSEESSSSSPKHIHHQSINYSSRDVTAPFDGIKEEEIHFMRKDDYTLGYGCDDFITGDFVLNEDFFSGLEEFDEFMSESQHHPPGSQQFPVRSCS